VISLTYRYWNVGSVSKNGGYTIMAILIDDDQAKDTDSTTVVVGRESITE